MALTKQAAAEAYELGAALAVEDAGLDKTASDPRRLQSLVNKAHAAIAVKTAAAKLRRGTKR